MTSIAQRPRQLTIGEYLEMEERSRSKYHLDLGKILARKTLGGAAERNPASAVFGLRRAHCQPEYWNLAGRTQNRSRAKN